MSKIISVFTWVGPIYSYGPPPVCTVNLSQMYDGSSFSIPMYKWGSRFINVRTQLEFCAPDISFPVFHGWGIGEAGVLILSSL